MDLLANLRLVLAHTDAALTAAVLFGMGVVGAFIVVRLRVEPLLGFPRWFGSKIRRLLEKGPSVPLLATFIFCFNSSAMFAYMLTGVLPGLPHVVSFLTGMNVTLAGLLAGADARANPPAPSVSPMARICGPLTFILELPCFWYSIGMGIMIRPSIFSLGGKADWRPLLDRAKAYLVIIVPVLAVSAVVEALAVCVSRRREPCC